MNRRQFMTKGVLLGLLPSFATSAVFANHGKLVPIKLSEEEWRKKLTAEEFRILREAGTEYPYSSPLNNEKREGIYHCAGCDLALFESTAKYDSGTGWPSFFQPIPGHLETKTDYRIIYPRTEYHCAQCGGHQGHVFDDGPRPTGQRWCNNGIALRFKPQDKESN